MPHDDDSVRSWNAYTEAGRDFVKAFVQHHCTVGENPQDAVALRVASVALATAFAEYERHWKADGGVELIDVGAPSWKI
jgi:hypothetical protein